MRILCAAIGFSVLGLAVACDRIGDDGYRFEGAEVERGAVIIKPEFYGSRADLVQAVATLGKHEAEHQEFHGASSYDPVSRICTIMVVDPAKGGERKWVGHETLHCLLGNWHRSQA